MSAKAVNEEAAQTVSPQQWIRLVVVYLLISLIVFIGGGGLSFLQKTFTSLIHTPMLGVHKFANQNVIQRRSLKKHR